MASSGPHDVQGETLFCLTRQGMHTTRTEANTGLAQKTDWTVTKQSPDNNSFPMSNM